MITPWGMYMNPSRTGGLYVLPSFGSAAIVSNSGRAKEAPIPCRHVRRFIIPFLVIGGPRFRARFWDSTMREWVTGHDRTDERLHAVFVRGNILHQSIDHNFVIAFQLSAQGVSKKSFHQVARKFIAALGDDRF